MRKQRRSMNTAKSRSGDTRRCLSSENISTRQVWTKKMRTPQLPKSCKPKGVVPKEQQQVEEQNEQDRHGAQKVQKLALCAVQGRGAACCLSHEDTDANTAQAIRE